jgi:hypothetical protein
LLRATGFFVLGRILGEHEVDLVVAGAIPFLSVTWALPPQVPLRAVADFVDENAAEFIVGEFLSERLIVTDGLAVGAECRDGIIAGERKTHEQRAPEWGAEDDGHAGVRDAVGCGNAHRVTTKSAKISIQVRAGLPIRAGLANSTTKITANTEAMTEGF